MSHLKKKKRGDEEPEEALDLAPAPAVKQRYPAPALLDVVSRMARAMYEVESDGAPVRRSLDSVVTAIMTISDLSVAEREYFDTFFAFLTAPWEGREDAEQGHVTPTPTPDVDELFE